MELVKAFEFNNAEVYQRPSDGYWNLTQMCSAGGKRLDHFFENKWTKAYLESVSAIAGKPGNELINTKKGGNNKEQGTWAHEVIAIRLAQWLSPEFSAKVDVFLYRLKKQYKNGFEEYVLLKNQKQAKPTLALLPYDEVDLQYRIHNWVNLCADNARFNVEVPLRSKYNDTLIRVDFIKNNPRNVIAYELKKEKVTLNDINEKLAHKAYFQIIEQHFGNRPLKIIFLSPKGIEDAALTMMYNMPNIGFQTVHELCYTYYMKGINNKYKHNMIQLHNQILTNRYNYLFDESFVDLVKQTISKGNGNKQLVLAA
ncbi:KilA-N domain-containing protein [Scytonema sp. NUACC26]|uniref:KilA-N domain-containing protein n=1 Tax=Scytonema sp. NUACC26 TaxID=3140176 RepID=UPI0034DC4D94